MPMAIASDKRAITLTGLAVDEYFFETMKHRRRLVRIVTREVLRSPDAHKVTSNEVAHTVKSIVNDVMEMTEPKREGAR
jgi:hypothetical protein